MVQQKIFVLIALSAALTPLAAQQKSRGWEAHAGAGMVFGVNGLPSQVSNTLAGNDNYLSNVSKMQGLPFGGTLLGGFGYKIDAVNSFGLEASLGLNADGGRARVTMGDNLPAYAIDAFLDAMGLMGAKYDFATLKASDLSMLTGMYKALSAYNTMKGYYLDPRLRAYYKADFKTWRLQAGAGLAVLIPFNYFAFPSKDHGDYTWGPENPQGSMLWNAFWNSGMAQFPIRPAHVPFPLRTLNGVYYMQNLQPLFDLSLRASLSHYFLDVAYATEFKHIHHVKISLGALLAADGSNQTEEIF